MRHEKNVVGTFVKKKIPRQPCRVGAFCNIVGVCMVGIVIVWVFW